jgi:hypothetical protein
MRKIEDVRKSYFREGNEIFITDEEKQYYHITDETLLEWRTENQLNEQKDFFQNVVLVNNNKSIWHDNYNNPILSNLEGINMNFSLSIAYRNAKPEVYDELEHLYDVALEYDIFDFYTFKNCTYTNSERKRNRMYIGKDYRYREEGKKTIIVDEWYIGLFPNLYKANKMDVFDRLMKIFINKVYPKYGLFLQPAMKMLIQFCKENKLEYVDTLLECHKNAMKEDYPSHHEYKYKFMKRDEKEWEEINL